MRLSLLQKFILKEGFGVRGRILRSRFNKFYNGKTKPSILERIKIISTSIDRLIAKGLLIGYGQKTQHKWFIKEVKLSPSGLKEAKRLLGEQTSLPFKRMK